MRALPKSRDGGECIASGKVRWSFRRFIEGAATACHGRWPYARTGVDVRDEYTWTHRDSSGRPPKPTRLPRCSELSRSVIK
jgi:hypothetical protein